MPQLPETGAVIGYARVSTDEQSTDMQIGALEKFGCHRIFSENVSGAAARRPELEKALSTMRPGDTLAVWSIDRLGRNARKLLELCERIKNDMGCRVVSLTQPFDTATAMGSAFLGLLAVFAEFERSAGRERINAGIQRRKERGEPLGAPREITDAEIEKAQKLRNKGLSLRQIAEAIGKSSSTVRNYTTPPEIEPTKRKGR